MRPTDDGATAPGRTHEPPPLTRCVPDKLLRKRCDPLPKQNGAPDGTRTRMYGLPGHYARLRCGWKRASLTSRHRTRPVHPQPYPRTQLPIRPRFIGTPRPQRFRCARSLLCDRRFETKSPELSRVSGLRGATTNDGRLTPSSPSRRQSDPLADRIRKARGRLRLVSRSGSSN